MGIIALRQIPNVNYKQTKNSYTDVGLLSGCQVYKFFEF
jgi:hypothetical protein